MDLKPYPLLIIIYFQGIIYITIYLGEGRMENKKLYISDIIGDEYKDWNNEKIILDCGTGRGKTYFILNIL